jgi:hypothetical protein
MPSLVCDPLILLIGKWGIVPATNSYLSSVSPAPLHIEFSKSILLL